MSTETNGKPAQIVPASLEAADGKSGAADGKPASDFLIEKLRGQIGEKQTVQYVVSYRVPYVLMEYVANSKREFERENRTYDR